VDFYLSAGRDQPVARKEQRALRHAAVFIAVVRRRFSFSSSFRRRAQPLPLFMLVPAAIMVGIHLDKMLAGALNAKDRLRTERFVSVFCYFILVIGIALP